MMKTFRNNKKVARPAIVGMVLFALAAPALAEHYDWSSFLTGEPDPSVVVTAEDAHMDCPVDEADADALTVEDCDAAVKAAATDLQAYDHPENHGKYVSFVAHCLKGMKGKGQVMRQIAQADEDEQQAMAVRLCAEWKLEQSSDESEDAEAASEGKSKKDKDDAEVEDSDADDENEVESSDDDGDEDGKPAKAKSRSRGRGRR